MMPTKKVNNFQLSLILYLHTQGQIRTVAISEFFTSHHLHIYTINDGGLCIEMQPNQMNFTCVRPL